MARKTPIEYKIEDLIIENNKELFKEVNDQRTVILKKDFKSGWMAKLEKSNADPERNIGQLKRAEF